METQLADLNAKLDALNAQVAWLVGQAEEAARERQSRAELLRDAMPIATTVMARASAHLQEVEEYVDLSDLVRVLKKLACQLPNFERAIDLLDSGAQLLDVAAPLGKDAFARAEAAMDGMDKRGYFAFARGGARIIDNVVTSFTAEDVDRLGDNIVLILRTLKDMTQPEMMTFLRSTVEAVEKDADAPVDIRYRALFGQLRDPGTRRGLAMTLRALGRIGATRDSQ